MQIDAPMEKYLTLLPALCSVFVLFSCNREDIAEAAPDLQSAVDGQNVIYVKAGTYRTGTIYVPADKTLVFDPEAVLIPVPSKIKARNLFVVEGDNVEFRGLRYDFAWNGADINTTPVLNLIYAKGVKNLTVSGAEVVNSDPRKLIPMSLRDRSGRFYAVDGTLNITYKGYWNSQCLLYAENCRDIVLENSYGSRLHGMIEAYNCYNVVSRGNRMETGTFMTHVGEGAEYIRHHDNWSRDVKYQISWYGGFPDPSRKDFLEPGTADEADRETKPGDPGYDPNTAGVYDVLVQNNYAEYGNTLAWGNKGRQVVIDGNIARWISDYAYGTEGGENVTFSNNVSVNCTAGGVVSMYWGEKILVTGNEFIVRDEPFDAEMSWWDDVSEYYGPFVKFHHGPSNPEDEYGVGSAMISGNLMINEFVNEVKDVAIQEGRDVTVSGNKIINGRVNKIGKGDVVVIGNEFRSRAVPELTCITVSKGAESAVVKDNVLVREDGYSIGGYREPAVVLAAQSSFDALVSGNYVTGWRTSLSADFTTNGQASIIVRDNVVDGQLNVPTVPEDELEQKNEIINK